MTFSGQIILIEEIYSTVWKNEFIIAISISLWLLGVAAGGWMGRKFHPSTDLLFFLILISFPLLTYLPVTYRVVSHSFMRVLSLREILIISAVTILPPGFITGVAFVSMVSRSGTSADTTATGYFLEGLGSTAGALLLFLLSLAHIPVRQQLPLILLPATLMLVPGNRRFLLVTIALISIAASFETMEGRIWNALTDGHLVTTSRGYTGELTLIEKNGEKIVFSGYFPLYSYPDPSAVNQILIPEFIAGRSSVSLLLVTEDGPNFHGYRGKLLVNRQDPVLRTIDEIGNLPSPAKTIYGDPLNVMKQITGKYDLIAVKTVLPSTIREERLFSRRFMQMAYEHLTDGGMLIYILGETQNYISEPLKDGLAWIMGRGRKIFQYATLLPLETINVVFSDTPLEIPNICSQRLARLSGDETFLNIAGRCNQSLINFYTTAVRPMAPPVYPYIYIAGLLRSFEENETLKIPGALLHHAIYLTVALFFVILFVIFALIFRRSETVSYLTTGFVGMSGEIMLLYLFQLEFGIVFLHISLILALYMLSLSAGSYIYLRSGEGHLHKATLPLLLISLPLLLAGKISLFYAGTILFAYAGGSIFAHGTLENYQNISSVKFVSSKAEFTDHLGGAMGSLMAPFMVTAFGLTTGMIIVILLVVIVVLLKTY